MSQTVVTSFYASKKRFKDPGKSLKVSENSTLSETFLNEETKSTSKSVEPPKAKAAKKTTKAIPEPKSKQGNKDSDYLKIQPAKNKPNSKSKKADLKKTEIHAHEEATSATENPKSAGKKTVTKAAAKPKGKQSNKVTNYLITQPAKSKSRAKNKKVEPPETAETLANDKILLETQHETPKTPSKRNSPNPDEATPSKKRAILEGFSTPTSSSKKGLDSTYTVSPRKSDARRKLLLSSPSATRFASPIKTTSPVMSPQKAASYGKLTEQELASLLNESRSKILFSNRLDELKKSLEKFSKESARVENFQTNACKITSVISSAKAGDDQPKPLVQGQPAFKKYSYLAAPESLVLPYKYKVLGEAFRCTDTVVSMMHNRKEKITFGKLQSGVQKMMNKNFPKSQLGQLITVFPEAYSLQYEKNNSYIINKNNSCYDLVLTPKLQDMNGNSLTNEKESTNNEKTSTSSFIQMTPQLLLERKNLFFRNLTNMTKKHHREFLVKLAFPLVDDNAIVRWHPKFKVDSVPDVSVASLPEEPESKVHSAKDVLNKIRGSVMGRVEKALQSVADEHKEDPNLKDSPALEAKLNSSNKKQSSALKGICTDLLEKIRARESAKLIETMTRSVGDEKRNAMIERLPKIVQIIWHYFIAERKSAVPVDAAVEKIIHSFNSLATPEAVKEHLQLITEVMPGWLSFIKIPKGEYITMNKTKDINEMIANLK